MKTLIKLLILTLVIDILITLTMIVLGLLYWGLLFVVVAIPLAHILIKATKYKGLDNETF